jgi:hypothetical protein
MFHRLSLPRAIVFVATFLLAVPPWGAPAFAKIVTFKGTGVGFPVETPDNWRIKPIARGMEISSPDRSVYIWVEATDAANVGNVVQAYFKYFKQQGITTREPVNQRKKVFGGVDVIVMDIPATYVGGPTILKLMMTDPRPNEHKGLFIGYWASPKGDQQHDEAVTGIMTDLLRP